ncbi:MAG: response regulator transcription factor [Verrucomicrobia bacterium]|nr:response regulator transcription factor [Verrucomicrobiota bacterium]
MSMIISDSNEGSCNGNSIEPPKTRPNGLRRQAAAVTSRKSQGGENKRCVFLVVDRPVTREGLALMLRQARFTIVGQAGNFKETFAHPNLALADAVIVDLLSGDKDLVCLIKALSSRQFRSVVCSIHEDSTCIRAALVAGASGYVTTNDETQHLIEAIRAVIGGRNYVSPRAGTGLARKVAGLVDPSPKEDLSKQQLQIYELLGQGDNAKEISSHLKISPRTVESYCSRMIYKLDLSGMKALRRLAISNVHSALLYA